jgi:hypothetical protein
MKGTARDVLKATVLLVGGFLVLVHFTGFERDVRSISGLYNSAVKTLQGR